MKNLLFKTYNKKKARTREWQNNIFSRIFGINGKKIFIRRIKIPKIVEKWMKHDSHGEKWDRALYNYLKNNLEKEPGLIRINITCKWKSNKSFSMEISKIGINKKTQI
jgi:hypothetical protein